MACVHRAVLPEASINAFIVFTIARPERSIDATAVFSPTVAALDASRAACAALYALRALVTSVVSAVTAAAVVPKVVGVAVHGTRCVSNHVI
jgi:hypothetical protein